MTSKIEVLYSEAEAQENGVSGVVLPYGDLAPRAGYLLQIQQGALAGRMSDVLVNLQHDNKQLLGRTGGNVDLTDTEAELLISMTYPDTQVGRDAKALVDIGVLTGFSAELQVLSDDWDGGVRRVDKARLSGIGLVARPAMSRALIQHNFMELGGFKVFQGGEHRFDTEELRQRELRGEMKWNEPSVVSMANREAVLFEPDSLDISNPITLMLGSDYNTSAANSAANAALKVRKTNAGVAWSVANMPRTENGEKILKMSRQSLITGWRVGYIPIRTRKSDVELHGLDMALTTVQEGMMCEVRLTSDGTGGAGAVSGSRRRRRRR